MAYPSQVTRERILFAAGEMIELGEVDTLSLAQLAHTLQIKPPSLYRYFPSKTALVDALRLETLAELTQAQTVNILKNQDPMTTLQAIARQYRAYALSRPKRYLLAFSASRHGADVQSTLLELALPLESVVNRLVSEDSLTHLRGFWALLHGFVMLEIGHMFQRGGDLDRVYDEAVAAYLRGIPRNTASVGP